jgi:transcriptional regulator with XRE-family HTH domain
MRKQTRLPHGAFLRYARVMPQRRATAREVEIRSKVAAALLRLRGDRSRAALGREMGTDRWLLERLERQEAPITLELVEQLARALGLSPLEFLCVGPDPIWPSVDLQSRLEAVQQRALAEAEAEVSRIRGRLGERFLIGIMDLAGRTAQQLQDLESRLNLIRHEVSIDNLNRELADQAREERASRKSTKERKQ